MASSTPSKPLYADVYVSVVVGRAGARAVVPWLLMSSLGYYHLSVSLVSDECHDEMWSTILAQPHLLRDHRHGCLITLDDARAGSLHGLPAEAYPPVVRGGLRHALDLTSQAPDPAHMREVETAPFSPPERVWDVYRYGRDVTWRQHLAQQKESTHAHHD